ncbi:MAG: copper-binding protein [Proteobacteria bacterium]|nr:copper-binding protein [Pseudomonadota bacterium]
MRRRFAILLLAGLLAAGTAWAQVGGGGPDGGEYGGPGGGRGHGGHGRGDGDASRPRKPDRPPPPDKPVNQIEIVGVVRAIDPRTEQITIAYEAVDALNWQPGVLPFVVGKSAMLNAVSVGQKVRFKLDSQRISDIRPF